MDLNHKLYKSVSESYKSTKYGITLCNKSINLYQDRINLVQKLAKDFSQIIGVKDSTANLYTELKIHNFKIFIGSEVRLLENLKIGGAGLISATANVTSSIAQEVYDSFKKGKTSELNEHLISVRKVFDKYNLISALHSYKAQEDSSYKNI